MGRRFKSAKNDDWIKSQEGFVNLEEENVDPKFESIDESIDKREREAQNQNLEELKIEDNLDIQEEEKKD